MSVRGAARTCTMMALACLLGCGDDESTDTQGSASASDSAGTETTDATSDSDSAATSSTGGSSETGSIDDPLVLGYCECMIINCHDPFHDMWGDADVDATMACQQDAAEVPQLGEDTEEGNYLECRIAACIRAEEDNTACQDALGQNACTE